MVQSPIRRLRQMAELDARLEELEGFSDFIKEYNVRRGWRSWCGEAGRWSEVVWRW